MNDTFLFVVPRLVHAFLSDIAASVLLQIPLVGLKGDISSRTTPSINDGATYRSNFGRGSGYKQTSIEPLTLSNAADGPDGLVSFQECYLAHLADTTTPELDLAADFGADPA